MHELSHYFFIKAYQNNSNPYFDDVNDSTRADAFRKVMKRALIGLYSNYFKDVDPLRLRNMSSWDIGKELRYKLVLHSGTVEERILSIYRDYKESEEAREFVVRLPDLIARGNLQPEMKFLKPLVDYYNDYIYIDCEKFNGELGEICESLRKEVPKLSSTDASMLKNI